MAHPRAGQLAQPEDLVDVDALLDAYADRVPDVDDPAQKVVFGTSGHRGTSLDGAFNEPHILAITQAICEYRAGEGITGPLLVGRDTHALSVPAWHSALEVLAANDVTVLVDEQDPLTPTPAVSHAILRLNRAGPPAQVDGIVITPSHNPPRDGGFKYNPPHGGPADSDATGWIADRANELMRAGRDGVKRVSTDRHPRRRARVRLPRALRRRPAVGARPRRDPAGGRADRRRPARRRQRRLLGRDRRAAPARPDRGQPVGRPAVVVHDARPRRQDPDGLLLAVRDGLAGRREGRVRHRDGQRRRLRPARHRHAGRRADEPEPLPRRGDRLPVRAPAGLGRSASPSARRWCRRR